LWSKARYLAAQAVGWVPIFQTRSLEQWPTNIWTVQARQINMKMSNKTAKRLAQQNKRGLTTSMVSGMSSSLAFTPVQGIELENPSARAAAVAANLKSGTESYFSDYAGFKSLHTKPKK